MMLSNGKVAKTMPDKKLTDSEIVKAWEYCATKGNCSSCFLKAEEYCTNILKRLTIDLFNRLQAENEKLTIRVRKAEQALKERDDN